MNPKTQAYEMGRTACLHGRFMIEDRKFGCLLATVGPFRVLLLIINWRRGWRHAARGDR